MQGKQLLGIAILVGVVAAVVGFGVWQWRAAPNDPNAGTDRGSAERDDDLATRVQRVLRDGDAPDTPDVIRRALDAPLRLNASAWAALAELALEAGHFVLAERSFERAYAANPDELQYEFRRIRLIYSAGRTSEARREWVRLLRERGLDLLSLPGLGNDGLLFSDHVAVLDGLGDRPVDDEGTVLARARLASHRGQIAEARELLAPLMESESPSTTALAMWGRIVLEEPDSRDAIEWVRRLPVEPAAADIWILMSRVARRLDQDDAALRCLLEAWQRDPNHYEATAEIGRALQARGDPREATYFVGRSEAIRDYANTCRNVHVGNLPTEQRLREAAREAESLDCLREARAWYQLAASLHPTADWAARDADRLSGAITPDSGRFPSDFDRRRALADGLPLPEWPAPRETPDHADEAIAFQFTDDAVRLGIDAVFDDGGDPTADETHLFEFTGGGVAVVDGDGDGWPDLYFTQGGPPPVLGRAASEDETARPGDRYFRNVDGTRFEEVTAPAGLGCDLYGQGCTVGDFDADGFPDLYVANIGRNCLYWNNGDGTFTEADPATLPHEAWTTSCVACDLKGDGLQDLYDVNQVVRSGIHARMCRRGDASVPCGPVGGLAAEQDRLFVNQGDGTFRDVTEESGIVADEGLGLGVVAADLTGNRRLDLFVANDARANFLFVNDGAEAGHPVFRERALLAGVAYNAAGRAQACMGVAADDFDADGRLDLFVTNFYADYNTLYSQSAELLFDDVSRESQLATASHPWLGFGTQFLDADLDGSPDLVVANGDVVDFSNVNPNRPYAQPMQFFRNRGGRFEEVSGAEVGRCFTENRVGRGLARLDWNRDGLEDFAVSNIDGPAALVTNRTATPHHRLAVRLVGTNSDRVAIGTRVVVTAGGRTTTRQLTGGDGYMASNERRLVFGLGTADTIESLHVEWTSGETATFNGLPVDAELLLIEGRNAALTLPVTTPAE